MKNICEDDVYEKYSVPIQINKYNGIIPSKYLPSELIIGINKTNKLKTSEFTVHAEQNIITYCAKNGIPTDGTTMYVTMSPCKQCAKLIAQAGITKLIYRDDYKDMSGIEFLKKVNIKVKKYNKRKHD